MKKDTTPKPRDLPVGNSNFTCDFNAMLELDVTETKDYAGNKMSVLTLIKLGSKSSKLLEVLNALSEETILQHFARACFV